MNLFEQYEKAQVDLENAKEKVQELQVTLYNRYVDDLNRIDTGTFSREDSGFNINIIKKETTTVDQTMADVVGIGFKKKYSLDKTAYKKLSSEDQRRVDECLTTKPAKPSFSVERIDNGN
jgi:hypothetical protein